MGAFRKPESKVRSGSGILTIYLQEIAVPTDSVNSQVKVLVHVQMGLWV